MITAIKWNNHSILGNLELNFTKKDGTAYETIIFAGENGSGKTTILETISTFLNLETIEPFKYIRYSINNTEYEIQPLKPHENLGLHIRKNLSDNSSKEVRTNRNNNPNLITKDLEDIRHYGVVYSKARSDFNTAKIDSTRTSKLDDQTYEIDQNNNFTSIKQLLVDLYMQDCVQTSRAVKEKHGLSESDYNNIENSSNISRFKKAFNTFFDKIQFDGVDPKHKNGFEILFQKNDKKISIDDLSTGEKQIIFRGSMLLKNLNKLENAHVFIDEPELSMHPKWQQKILKFYQNLFVENGNQKVQMFFATHSENVIEAAIQNKEDTLIVVLNENCGVIEATYITDALVLPTITASEINYIAFQIPSVDLHAQLYAYLQSKTGNDKVLSCDKYIEQQAIYNPSIHYKLYTATIGKKTISYNTLPTYIRNCIDHPDAMHNYTNEELEISIQLLRELCK